MRSSSHWFRSMPVALLLIAGCDAPTPSAENAASSESSANAAQPVAAPTPAQAGAIREKIGEIEFDYGWPVEAAQIPALDAWLRANGERLRTKTLEEGRSGEAAAKKDGYPFHGQSYQEKWGVVANVPALLVMQSEGYVFTGGAHGMPIVTTLIWDKASGEQLPVGAVLDTAALEARMKDRFCKALDAERAKRRSAPVDAMDPDQLSEFVRCVEMGKQTILPVSSGGQALDTIRIVIMPYEAGPYAEGIYQIDLPVDAAVMGAIKPAYRGAFTAS